MYAKFRCAPLHIKKAWGIFTELITTRRTTRVAFWDQPSGSKNSEVKLPNCLFLFNHIFRLGRLNWVSKNRTLQQEDSDTFFTLWPVMFNSFTTSKIYFWGMQHNWSMEKLASQTKIESGGLNNWMLNHQPVNNSKMQHLQARFICRMIKK